MIKYISREEYVAMFERMKGCIRGESIGMDPAHFTIEEIVEAHKKQLNPDLPMQINMHDAEGLTCYRIGKQNENV